MSTTPFAGPYPTTIAHILVHHITTTPAARPASQTLRRQPTRQQGHSLEKLGHAIEYLVDSQLDLTSSTNPKAAAEAAHILMRLSREVFAECRAAAPARQSLLHLFTPRRTA